LPQSPVKPDVLPRFAGLITDFAEDPCSLVSVATYALLFSTIFQSIAILSPRSCKSIAPRQIVGDGRCPGVSRVPGAGLFEAK
jgi:hypothetical protein